MSYTPTEWATGDVITADKLNNMEDGIVKGVRLIKVNVNLNEDGEATFGMTCGEIKAIIMGGGVIYLNLISTHDGQTICAQVLPEQCRFKEGGGGTIVFGGIDLNANTDNDYPTQVSG